jgi:protein-disulfide isomerase-like protein with CxxC motif
LLLNTANLANGFFGARQSFPPAEREIKTLDNWQKIAEETGFLFIENLLQSLTQSIGLIIRLLTGDESTIEVVVIP